MKDGIKTYFTRLEQARRMKKEAHDRLGIQSLRIENWGRDKSKSQVKAQGPNMHASISGVKRFESPGMPKNEGPLWETPGNKADKYSSNKTKEKVEVDRTIEILRNNLKKIQIHLG